MIFLNYDTNLKSRKSVRMKEEQKKRVVEEIVVDEADGHASIEKQSEQRVGGSRDA